MPLREPIHAGRLVVPRGSWAASGLDEEWWEFSVVCFTLSPGVPAAGWELDTAVRAWLGPSDVTVEAANLTKGGVGLGSMVALKGRGDSGRRWQWDLILSLQPPLCEPAPKGPPAPIAPVQCISWWHCPMCFPEFSNVMQNPIMPIMRIT